MRIDVTRQAMAVLRGLRESSGPLWQAIEELRHNPTPADAIAVPGEPTMLQKHVRIGEQGYWLIWEAKQDRSEMVVRVAIIEQN